MNWTAWRPRSSTTTLIWRGGEAEPKDPFPCRATCAPRWWGADAPAAPVAAVGIAIFLFSSSASRGSGIGGPRLNRLSWDRRPRKRRRRNLPDILLQPWCDPAFSEDPSRNIFQSTTVSRNATLIKSQYGALRTKVCAACTKRTPRRASTRTLWTSSERCWRSLMRCRTLKSCAPFPRGKRTF